MTTMTKKEAETPAVHVKKSEKELDNSMVKGRFRCFEPVGGGVKLSYRKHKGEPIRTYEFRDGEVYTIPLGLAKHLRENCMYYEHSHLIDTNGNPMVNRMGRRVDRMTFEPLEFSIDNQI